MNGKYLAAAATFCLFLVTSASGQGKESSKEAESKRARIAEERARLEKERAIAAELEARRALIEKERAIRLERIKAGARAAEAKAMRRLELLKRVPRKPEPSRKVEPKAAVGPTSLPTPSATIDESKFALTLADKTKLVGEPVGLAKVAIQTSFGMAQVPLAVIQRIEGVPNAAGVKIHFRNGDVVSGVLQAQKLRFKTRYGEVEFAANELVRMQIGTRFESPTTARTARRTRPSSVRRRFGATRFGGERRMGLPGGGFGGGGFRRPR